MGYNVAFMCVTVLTDELTCGSNHKSLKDNPVILLPFCFYYLICHTHNNGQQGS